MAFSKDSRRAKIRTRIRARVKGTDVKPRLSVFRSNKEIYAQLIDDVNGKTLVAANSRNKSIANAGNKVEKSHEVGKALATAAVAKGITACVFDRGGNLYHGRIKALAEGAREGGLNF
jgi:large subunit ribosomal protein L18